ncbi:unnamed protein product [Nippostrongylus brasiliensis]|uniref:Uncharacterized protein n=1 Tax=Nippostrongylus brasiliensis TaxID=27835 RepID=A0A0N4XKJ4_NIPBR|nr:unnamed protein product [Nippostrongylus brasiliensis]
MRTSLLDEYFTDEEESECPDIISDHIRDVAVDGHSCITWDEIKAKLPARVENCLKIVCNHHRRRTGQVTDLGDGSETRDLLKTVITKALSFNDLPFTWRRFCELLYDPLRHYSHPMKYLRALFRVINVETTLKESIALRREQPPSHPNFASISLFFDDSMTQASQKRPMEDTLTARKVARGATNEDKENAFS